MKPLLTLVLLCAIPMAALAQSAAFTYQGQLTENTAPANGTYEFMSTLFNGADAGAAKIAGPLTNSTAVGQGLFILPLDFGPAFPGADRWLELAVRTNGAGAFVPLSPRQLITATPYALTARNVTGVISNASLAGTYSSAVAFNNSGNAFSGNGAALTGVNAAALGGLSANQFWKTAGNAATGPANFVGTTDNQPLELRVNGGRALRLQPNTNATFPPSFIAGSISNLVSPGTGGAAIAGGDKNFIESFNGAESHFAAIGGGSSNHIGYFSFNAVIGGGLQNTLEPNTYYSTIAGGIQNRMGFHAFNSIISGGRNNAIDESIDTATIGGGGDNSIQILANYSVIGAGRNNQILSNAEYAVIGGGRGNRIEANADYAHIGGGEANQIRNGLDCTIGGGGANAVGANSGTIAGGASNAIETNAFEATIGGGFGNIIHTNALRSTIAGGVFHEILTDAGYSFIGGGTRNKGGSNSYHATIVGGSNNEIDHDTSYCFIGGGKLHTVMTGAAHAVIAGGDGNVAGGEAPAIGGGTLNGIDSGTVYAGITSGGGNHIISPSFGSTIAGGYLNQVAGNFSFAAGKQAQANHPGTFTWAGGNTLPYASIFPNAFNIYASNGVSMDYGPQTPAQPRGARYVYVGPFNAGSTIAVWNGARLTDAGIWSNASDKNRKTGFHDVDAREVLNKLVALPVRQWRYTNETTGVKHLGPVAQDFQAAFGLGDDDKTIGTVDADGVALAAIQGLNQKLREELDRRDVDNAELKRRLERLEERLNRPAGN